jgi:hypothetical protein
VAMKRVPLFTHEVLGRERLIELANVLYGEDDPALVVRTEAPYTFEKRNSHYEVRLRLPTVQERRRAGGGDRYVAPPHWIADLHGRAHSHASVATE